jgi:RNA polymerase sigma-70 factor (ECF subfamily)
LAPDQLQAREQRIAVRRAVANLSEDLREAVVLCELEDQPIVIAAAILKTTPKAIESRLYRARKLLRSQLKSWL